MLSIQHWEIGDGLELLESKKERIQKHQDLIIMPNHKVHDTIGILSGSLISIALYYFNFKMIDCLIFLLAFLFGTLYLSPDIDLTTSRPYNRWKIFRFVWWPYQKWIATAHKEKSHGIITGPITIIGYLGLVTSILVFLLTGTNLLVELIKISLFPGIAFIGAIEMHIITDMIT